MLGDVKLQSRLPESFKDEAFALEEVGDVSDIVETPFGFHVIKLLGVGELPTYEEARADLKETVSRAPRAKAAERDYARSLWQTYGGHLDTTEVLRAASAYPLDSLLAWGATNDLPVRLDTTQFAVFEDSTYTLADFFHYAQERGVSREFEQEEALEKLAGEFGVDAALDYETAALEERNPEFGRVMTEFREGLLLFALMEDSVWNAAAQDSAALMQHWDVNKEAYRFPERTRVIAYYSASDSLLREVALRLEEGVPAEDLATDFLGHETLAARIDTVRIAEPTGSVFDQALTIDAGKYLGPMRHNREWVLLQNEGIEAPRLKTYQEARAAVLSEYQDEVEGELVERLRERYDVHMYPERLTRAFEEEPAVQADSSM